MAYPILKIWDQGSFERANLNEEFRFAISIQNKVDWPSVLRRDFQARRLDLYFNDTIEGAGMATSADIQELFDFGQRWLQAARSDPAKAAIVIHCGAGISRSAAAAFMLLNLYFDSYRPAANYLFRTHPHVAPNTLVLRLIFQKLGPAYGADIFEAIAQGKQDASKTGR
jgi:predicted protein tyrosine phosphatase